MTSTDKDRKDFETWAVKHIVSNTMKTLTLRLDSNGNYENEYTLEKWTGWQASAQLQRERLVSSQNAVANKTDMNVEEAKDWALTRLKNEFDPYKKWNVGDVTTFTSYFNLGWNYCGQYELQSILTQLQRERHAQPTPSQSVNDQFWSDKHSKAQALINNLIDINNTLREQLYKPQPTSQEVDADLIIKKITGGWDDLLEDLELHGMHDFEPYVRSKAKFKALIVNVMLTP